jgi:hypothetical protein
MELERDWASIIRKRKNTKSSQIRLNKTRPVPVLPGQLVINLLGNAAEKACADGET